jgi:hypothetical protein
MDARPSRLVAEVAATPGTATSTGSSTATMARPHPPRPAPSQRDLDVDLVGDHVGEELRPHLRKRGKPAASIRTSSRFAAVRCRVK